MPKSALSIFSTRFGELIAPWDTSHQKAFTRWVILRKRRLFSLDEPSGQLSSKPSGRLLLDICAYFFEASIAVQARKSTADTYTTSDLKAEFAQLKSSKINDYLSDLYELAKEFLAFELIQDHPALSSRILLIAARDHPSEKFFADALKRSEKAFSTLTQSFDLWHAERYFQHMEVLRHEVMTRRTKSDPDWNKGYTLVELQALHQFLRLRVQHQNGAKILEKIQTPDSMPGWALALIEKHGKEPLIDLYLKLLEYGAIPPASIEVEQHKALLDEIKKMFLAVVPQLTADERFEIFGLVCNAYTFLISHGVEVFLPVLTDWYLYGEETGIFLGEENFTIYGLKNFLAVAGRIGRGEVVERLFRRYETLAAAEHPIYTLYLEALMYFFQGQYRWVQLKLSLIAQTPGTLDTFLEEAIISLRIKMAIEQEEYNQAQDEIDRMRRRKSTSPLDENVFQNSLNRIRYIEQFLRIPPNDRESKDQLLLELQQIQDSPLKQTHPIDNPSWLIGVLSTSL